MSTFNVQVGFKIWLLKNDMNSRLPYHSANIVLSNYIVSWCALPSPNPQSLSIHHGWLCSRYCLNPKPFNEPVRSAGHGKTTTGQLWHCSHLFGLCNSVISALSNVLCGSNCMIDPTELKPLYPFSSFQRSTTTNHWNWWLRVVLSF